MAKDSSTGNFLTVDVHYNGRFSRNPFVYLDSVRVCIKDVDFGSFDLMEFKTWLQKLIKRSCNDVYYCISKESLASGIKRVDNECDYLEFICDGYSDGNDLSMSIYVDHEKKPIIEWADEEAVYEEGNEDEGQQLDDDKNSECSDAEIYEHEVDEEVPTFDKTVSDPFLHKLSGIPISNRVSESLPVYPVHNENLEWNKMVPILGMKFSNPLELKQCVTNYAVAGGFDLWYEKNDKDRLLVKCSKNKGNGCPFRLWATWNSERSFQIKTLDANHSCSRVFNFGSIVTYKWIGKHMRNEILQNPRLSLRKLKGLISKRFNLIASVCQCRNAKKYALNEIEGSLVEHYAKVWSYGEELRRSNPGSTIKIGVDVMPDGKTYFSKFYVCFKGVKDGWIEGCRRVIGLDGCFLKGVCRGQLLAAVGRDANNQIYPLAWAVVAVECKETWKWFVDLLVDDIQMGIGHGLTIISDGHKGILEAISERLPAAEHRQCARHIYVNFRKRFKGEHFRKLFWAAAGSTTQQMFEHRMNEIRVLEPQAYTHLMERDPKSWCKAFFQVDRCCDAYENGISESFNAVIEEARKRPIITMLEEVRIYVMTRIYEMKKKAEAWNLDICPSIRGKLEVLKKKHRYWTVLPAGFQQFEARLGTDVYAVDLINKTCGCRAWQLTGVPCVHGMAAITNLNVNAEDYVAPWFKTEMFLRSYKYSIRPLNGADMWPEVDYAKPLPPKQRRLPGRPTVKRKRDESEMDQLGKTRIPRTGVVLRCSLCKETWHNKLTCWKKGESKTHEGTTKGSDVPERSSVPPVSTQPQRAPPVPPVQRVKRSSARITKKKLGKNVDIKEGSTHQHPLDLD